MIEPIIYGLSNEGYHNSQPYSEYLSSSQLKWYLKSPRHAKFMLDNPTDDKSDALRFGSLFHDLMGSIAERKSINTGLLEWYSHIAMFQAPVNPKTDQPYGATTKAHKEAYEAFLSDNAGKIIADDSEVELCRDMMYSLCEYSGATSEQVRKLLKWGKPEASHFIEYEGRCFKWRPDLETKRKIVDWKTVATDDLSEESVNRIILKYGYHISSSFYQFFEHEQSGIWKQFILCLVSKVPPHDCVMVDMCNYGYRYYPEADMVGIGPGAMEFKRLLDLHIRCEKEHYWPGAEQAIPDNNGVRILEIQPPKYYANRFIEEV